MVPSIDTSLSLSAQKTQLLATLRGLLRDVIRLRREGVAYPKLAAAQGYADGFMRALIDGGVCTQQELLTLVAEVRRGIDGPAVAAVVLESDEAVAAA